MTLAKRVVKWYFRYFRAPKCTALDQDFPRQVHFCEALVGYVFLVREHLEVFEHVFGQPDGDRFQGGALGHFTNEMS